MAKYKDDRLEEWFRKYKPISGGASVITRPDYFAKQKQPQTWDLINSFKRTAYTCASINANACARIPIKLYVKTRAGDKNTKLKTRDIKYKSLEYLEKNYSSHFTKALKNVEEVSEHPVLDLLEKVNADPYCNGNTLRVLTHLYQEITGISYTYVESNFLGIPENLYLLETQHVEAKSFANSSKPVDYFQYNNEKYLPEEIILYNFPDLCSPYIKGLPPHLASWEADLLANKLASLELGLLDNEARPDAMISPSGDNVFGTEEAKRMELRLNQKFNHGKGGGIFVTEEPIEWNPLSYPPRDLAKLEISSKAEQEICSTFGVPVILLDSRQINKEGLIAALQQHALIAISPRLVRDAAVKNKQLLSKYDDTGRLFLAYDNPVPEDKTLYLQETVQLVMNGIMTPNEGRDRHNLPPIAGEDKLRPINVAAETNAGAKRNDVRNNGTAKK